MISRTECSSNYHLTEDQSVRKGGRELIHDVLNSLLTCGSRVQRLVVRMEILIWFEGVRPDPNETAVLKIGGLVVEVHGSGCVLRRPGIPSRPGLRCAVGPEKWRSLVRHRSCVVPIVQLTSVDSVGDAW